MKVIISCLNSKYIHASLAPWCLLSGVKAFAKNDYDIKVLESTINGNLHDFAQKIILEKLSVCVIVKWINTARRRNERGVGIFKRSLCPDALGHGIHHFRVNIIRGKVQINAHQFEYPWICFFNYITRVHILPPLHIIILLYHNFSK